MSQQNSASKLAISDQDDEGQDRKGLERLVFFSDAIFAIAITLLVLDIHLPETSGDSSDTALLHALWELKDRYYSFLISFIVIGLYWLGHQRMFRYIIRYNSQLLFINLAQMLFITFLPFPASVIAEYNNKVATIFYALVVAITGFVASFMWWYVSHNHRMIEKSLSAQIIRRNQLVFLNVPLMLLLSALIALWNVELARLLWFVLIAAAIIIRYFTVGKVSNED